MGLARSIGKRKQPDKEPAQLEEKELWEIKEQLNKGRSIEEILHNDYPHTIFTVTHGLDRFDGSGYIQNAHFDYDTALQEKRAIPPNGTPGLCDLYKLAQYTITNEQFLRFDSYDKERIFWNLEEKFCLTKQK